MPRARTSTSGQPNPPPIRARHLTVSHPPTRSKHFSSSRQLRGPKIAPVDKVHRIKYHLHFPLAWQLRVHQNQLILNSSFKNLFIRSANPKRSRIRPASSSRTILFSLSALPIFGEPLNNIFHPPSFVSSGRRKKRGLHSSFAIFIAHAHARHRFLGPCMLPPLLNHPSLPPSRRLANNNNHRDLLLTRPSHELLVVMEAPGMYSFSTLLC
ncbi:hypothetical protein J3F84DRAFT_139287 [Trichoderma pleuroticola]